jgi:hypothetical protein
MIYDELLKVVAPCGLYCGKCLAYPESPISRLSRQLREELGGFPAITRRFAAMDPVFDGYDQFQQILDKFAQGGCSGCRSGDCLYRGCRVKRCTLDKKLEFCFQCPDFPCSISEFPPSLKERWEAANRKMGEQGVLAYFEAVKDKPRY